jgi:hypothetical protein
MNLELATKSVNNIRKSIDCDILEVEVEVAAKEMDVSDSQAADIKEICLKIKEQVLGEFARAGEKLQTTELQLKRMRTVLASLRRARSSSTPLSSGRASLGSAAGASTPGFRPTWRS